MNRILHWLATTCACIALSGTVAFAQWEPEGRITLIIGFASGTNGDTQARQIADELERRHGWKIVPRRIIGDGGAMLVERMKQGPNDGTLIAMVPTKTFGYSMVANADAGYIQADITTLTTTSALQTGIVALASRNWDDLGDVIAAARSGQNVRFGTMSPKLADLAFLIGDANGIEFNIIEVETAREVVKGVNGGDMDIGFMDGTQTKGVLSGDLVNLASAHSTPLQISPNAPRISEYGVEFTADGYFMFIGPAGMPPDTRDALTSAIANIVTDRRSKTNKFITKTYGSAVVISGHDLDSILVNEAVEAERLLSAAR